MENSNALFRQEAINNRINRSLGSTRINVPINYLVTGYGALSIVVLLILLIYFAKISEQHFVQGYLDSENGIISVESEFYGTIQKASIKEGMSDIGADFWTPKSDF